MEDSQKSLFEEENLKYYQKTFANLIQSMLDWYSPIFFEEEIATLKTILGLDDDAEKLFIRIFLRKHDWVRITHLQYPEVKDKERAITTLQEKDLIEVGSKYEEDYLNRLTKEEAFNLAQNNCVITQKSIKKEELTLQIKNISTQKSKQTKISVGINGTLCAERCVEVSVKSVCGEILRIKKLVTDTLDRCVKLFLLEWNQANSSNNTLGTAILVDLNKRKYPKYEMLRTRPIFESRQEYYEYEEALSYEREETLLGSELIEHWDYSLSQIKDGEDYFVRRYRPAWIYTRIMSAYASNLESMGIYGEANEILLMLLSQEKIMLGGRAAWWERLIINYSKHLKNPEKAIEMGQRALDDSLVRSGRLLTIKRKLHRLQTGKIFSETEYEPPSIVIHATPLMNKNGGKKLQFELDSGEVGGVEEVVLEKWIGSGWIGFHSENCILSFLFVLLFWEELFELPIPNVFQSPYQPAPLDLFTDAFWLNRKDALLTKLEMIGKGEAERMITRNYVRNYGMMVIGGHWEMFSLKDVLRISKGLGPKALEAMMRLLAEDYKHFCTGFPDLILYCVLENDEGEEVEVKLIEVKSERDRLSDAQRNWHSIFLANNVPMLVVKVLPEVSEPKKKRLKRSVE